MIEHIEFNIRSNFVSKRLFFAKRNFGDSAWHILDFSMRQKKGDFIYTMALHGEFELAVMEADTVDEIERLSPRIKNHICSGCLNVFAKAKDQIMNNPMLAFYDSAEGNPAPLLVAPDQEN